MIEVKGKVRKWGRSLGVVIPKETIDKEGIKENEDITMLISKPSSVLRDTFGTFKFKKNTEEMMKEIDKELYDD